MKRVLLHTVRQARRVAVAVVGGTVVAIGLALIVLPGPAFIVIPAGLGILAIEFTWARHLLARVRQRTEQLFSPSQTPPASS